MGPYITRIATNLGVFDTYPPEFLHQGPTTTMFGLLELKKAGIVTWTEPYGWKPIQEGPHVPQQSQAPPAKDVSIQTEPTQMQQPSQAGAVDWGTSEDVLRYMMAVQSMRILDFFRPGQAGVGAQADPDPPFQVYEASSHDSDSEQDEEYCGDGLRM
ncbi:hypothetical protein Hanom_Chr01g00040981 [Helianthus anomalus]